MLISLDYDQTYTCDPELWDSFIRVATSRGHTVICVTMRYLHEGDVVLAALSGKVSSVVFTRRKAKKKFLADMNIYPDVWIDDRPDFILNDALT